MLITVLMQMDRPATRAGLDGKNLLAIAAGALGPPWRLPPSTCGPGACYPSQLHYGLQTSAPTARPALTARLCGSGPVRQWRILFTSAFTCTECSSFRWRLADGLFVAGMAPDLSPLYACSGRLAATCPLRDGVLHWLCLPVGRPRNFPRPGFLTLPALPGLSIHTTPG